MEPAVERRTEGNTGWDIWVGGNVEECDKGTERDASLGLLAKAT